jgi:hypothetical protein
MRRHALMAAVLAILATQGCSREHHRVIAPAPPTIPSLTVDELLAAPDSLRVDGKTLTTAIYIWRDWFGHPTDGSDLYAALNLNSTPPGNLPSSIRDVYIWLIRDSEVWSEKMTSYGIDPSRSNSLLFQIEDGPRWDTGILIDVVIGVRTSSTQVSLVLFRDVLIHMTS